jgi:protein-S-isoprenylcysteine O-methyltransferase Ste14
VTVDESDIRSWVFRLRSYTPIPFLLIMLWFARPTVVSLVVGFTIVFVGEMIRFWGVSIVGAETRTTGAVGGTYLITTGPFSYVRNPLYLGNMMLYTGVGVMSVALFPWLQIVALTWFYVQYTLIVSREEEYLAKAFEGEYEDYRKNVRRFLPRLTPYRSTHPPAKGMSTSEGIASERRTLQAIVLVTAIIAAIYVIQVVYG